TLVHFTEILLVAGLVPAVGTVGDALDNALAETTMGLYKIECVRQDSPFRTGPISGLADLEDCTSAWVHWYNTGRLMTASTADHLPRPRPSTTLLKDPASRPMIFTHNEACTKLGSPQ